MCLLLVTVLFSVMMVVLIIVVMVLMVVLFLVADALGDEYCILIGGRFIDGDDCVGDVNDYGDCCVWWW